MTDKVPLIPFFLHIGCIEQVIQWFETDIFGLHINELGIPLFVLIHNLSRDEMGSRLPQDKKAFDAVIRHKQAVDDQNDKELTLSFGTVLIDIVPNDELLKIMIYVY